MKIFKYPFAISEYINIDLPASSQILTVQVQYDTPTIWALVDENQKIFVTKGFRIFATGQQIKEDNLKYVGTFQLKGGTLVFHLFERGRGVL